MAKSLISLRFFLRSTKGSILHSVLDSLGQTLPKHIPQALEVPLHGCPEELEGASELRL